MEIFTTAYRMGPMSPMGPHGPMTKRKRKMKSNLPAEAGKFDFFKRFVTMV